MKLFNFVFLNFSEKPFEITYVGSQPFSLRSIALNPFDKSPFPI